MNETKKCIKCLQNKPLDQFGANSKTKDGLRVDCRDCVKEYNQFKPTVIIAYISSLYNFAD